MAVPHPINNIVLIVRYTLNWIPISQRKPLVKSYYCSDENDEVKVKTSLQMFNQLLSEGRNLGFA